MIRLRGPSNATFSSPLTPAAVAGAATPILGCFFIIFVTVVIVIVVVLVIVVVIVDIIIIVIVDIVIVVIVDVVIVVIADIVVIVDIVMVRHRCYC